jgi:hypothetical protein
MAAGESIILALVVGFAGAIGYKDGASQWDDVMLAVLAYLSARYGGGKFIDFLDRRPGKDSPNH